MIWNLFINVSFASLYNIWNIVQFEYTERSHSGCNICIVSGACGRHIAIRSDLQICQFIPAINIHENLPGFLKYLLSKIPKVDDMPLFSTKSEAGVQMLAKVRQKLLSIAKSEPTEKLLWNRFQARGRQYDQYWKTKYKVFRHGKQQSWLASSFSSDPWFYTVFPRMFSMNANAAQNKSQNRQRIWIQMKINRERNRRRLSLLPSLNRQCSTSWYYAG